MYVTLFQKNRETVERSIYAKFKQFENRQHVNDLNIFIDEEFDSRFRTQERFTKKYWCIDKPIYCINCKPEIVRTKLVNPDPLMANVKRTKCAKIKPMIRTYP